jgi:hypothetical protein
MTASLDDVVTKQQATIQQLSAIYTALLNIFRNTGTFTMGAAATTVVANVGIQANSQIILIPTNAAAGTLIGSTKSPYVSARSVGTSFTVATASAASAAGTETFFYIVVTPV